MHTEKDIAQLAEDFKRCQKILTAFGDANRQHMILEMMKMGNCSGVRVNEITAVTNLSRPAVSHHLQILKNAGILKMRREGTKNYYYFDPDMESFELLADVLKRTMQITADFPDRSGNKSDV